MQTRSFISALRRGRASWSLFTLYALLIPILLGVLPKPEATTEFLLLRDLANAQICSMPEAGEIPGQPAQHRPDCILCATACPSSGPATAPLPTGASILPLPRQHAPAPASPRVFALSTFGLFSSDIQSRGPPA
jgi:hypothetical protein